MDLVLGFQSYRVVSGPQNEPLSPGGKSFPCLLLPPGNSQYSQQQAGYQQGAAQQQTYSQQQYPSQQSYPGQQQGYGPAQGAPSQYPSYQQGQGQQYGSYRAPQTAPSAQQQRPYGYEQGQYGNYQQ